MREDREKWYNLLLPALDGVIDADHLLDDDWSTWEKGMIIKVAMEVRNEKAEEQK